MPKADTEFKVVLEEEISSDAELKFNIKGSNFTGQEQQQSLVDCDIGSSLLVLADMTQVYHGTLVEGGSPATLIVLKFEFQPSGNYRRFKSVEAKMTFTKGTNSTTLPEVIGIAPKEAWSILPSKTREESSHTVSPSIEGGAGPATAKAAYTWQFKKTLDKEHSARISGTIRALGRDRSKKNTAIWTLLENPDTESGIPTLLQTAILLEREKTDLHPEGDKFRAALDIRGEVDKVTWFQDLCNRVGKTVSGKTEKGQDVIFNPDTNRGMVRDPKNLGAEDLERFSRVVTLREWKDGEEEEEKKKKKGASASDEEEGAEEGNVDDDDDDDDDKEMGDS